MANDPMLDSDDEETEDAPSAGDSADETDASDSPATTAAAPAPINPQVAAYLQNKQDMQSAQETARSNRLIAGLSRAGGTLARGRGQVTAADNAAYSALDQEAEAPVQDLLTEQKSDAAEASNEATEEANDPDSPKSKAIQSMIQKLYPGKFTPEQLSKLSAADAQDVVFKPLELDEKIKEAQANHQMLRQDRIDKAQTKATDAQSKVYTTMRKDMESFRGNQAMQQAALAVLNSDKALALVQSTPTPQNLNLLADEMGKIATGGVPGEHGTQALLPNNLYTKVAEIKSWVTGHPNASSADVSEYLQNNKDYINQVKSIAAKGLHDYRTNIAKGYKARVSPDQYQEASDDYGLGGARAPDASQPAPAPASAPPAQSPAASHPQAQAAMQWAQNNPGDPRAKIILQRLGQQKGNP